MSITTYLQETKAEMKHVNWPTRRQTVVFTTVVISLSAIVAVVLGLSDAVFNFLLKLVI